MTSGMAGGAVRRVRKDRIKAQLWRLAVLVLVAGLGLQLCFALRVGWMAVVAPESTAFQRSEIVRLIEERHELPWRHEWVDYPDVSVSLKRAVIASEDAGFADHSGIEWDAIEKAWERNQIAEERAAKASEEAARRIDKLARQGRPVPEMSAPKPVRIVGGSTISQQLAKNLFLSGERTAVRKAQEVLITYMLEGLLNKRRIYEIYLNNVEWGAGVFGAQAAAQRYFRVDAARLAPTQAARLAVMLPAPRRFELRQGSRYLNGRVSTVMARMHAVDLP